MPNDLQELARAARLALSGDRIAVELPQSRRHEVSVEARDGAWRIWAKAVRSTGDPEYDAIRCWKHNHGESLTSFRIDERRWLIGEAWVPFAGATPQEFAEIVRAVAIDCDRVEHLRTGRDDL
jgi:hypothetical protein